MTRMAGDSDGPACTGSAQRVEWGRTGGYISGFLLFMCCAEQTIGCDERITVTRIAVPGDAAVAPTRQGNGPGEAQVGARAPGAAGAAMSVREWRLFNIGCAVIKYVRGGQVAAFGI